MHVVPFARERCVSSALQKTLEKGRHQAASCITFWNIFFKGIVSTEKHPTDPACCGPRDHRKIASISQKRKVLEVLFAGITEPS